MAKKKRHRYERVKFLPNVIIPDQDLASSPPSYPWAAPGFSDKKIILELGCGKGEHSLEFAQNNPDSLCLGVDCKSHRLCVGGEQAQSLGLDNLYFLRAQIEEIRTFFPDRSIDEIWLTFPDPHPKQRSIKHRLTSPRFLDAYSRLLVPGGIVHLKTDNDQLYTYSKESADYWGGRILAATRNLHEEEDPALGEKNIVSAFEAKALARKETIKYLAFSLD